MPIYDRPTKDLMHDFAAQTLKQGEVFDKSAAVDWFRSHYPNIKSNTVQMHVEAMAVNSSVRKHHPSIRPGSNHDLFFKVGSGRFRLWDKGADPAPYYPSDSSVSAESTDDEGDVLADSEEEQSREFAFEKDLQNFLVKNLSALEPGLHVYQEEGLSGVEFPAGGRFIDILAVDSNNDFVVIELKVSRGHDRVIGQLLRYIAWIKQNIANGRHVRGIIVASEMSDDIKLAASLLHDVRLIEYELSFKLKPVAM